MLGRKSKPDEGQRAIAAAQAQGVPAPQVVFVQTEKKRGGCLRIVFGSLAVIVVVIAAAVLLGDGTDEGGSGGNPDEGNDQANTIPTPEPKGTENNPAIVGDTVTADGLAITLNSTSTADTATGGMSVPEVGNVYVILDITIKNVSEERESFNALYWSAKDTERGFTFDDAIMASTGQNISSGDLSPADLVRGNVVLEVKADTPVLRIKYDTSPIGGKNMFWTMSM